MVRWLCKALLVCLGAGLGSGAWSATVFDNFGPSNETGAIGIGLGAFGSIPNATFEYAVAYSVGNSDLALERLDLALAHNEGLNVFSLRVHEAEAGLPGLVISSTTYTDLMPEFVSTGKQPVSIEFSTPITLRATQQYWFSVSVPGSTSAAAWMQTNQHQIPVNHSARLLPDAWFDATGQIPGAFRVVASPVPELPANLLVVAGLAYVGIKCRRRNT